MAVRLNRYVTQVSQRVHLDEIAVICAPGRVRRRARREDPLKSG
jgi:hypothetical protein